MITRIHLMSRSMKKRALFPFFSLILSASYYNILKGMENVRAMEALSSFPARAKPLLLPGRGSENSDADMVCFNKAPLLYS